MLNSQVKDIENASLVFLAIVLILFAGLRGIDVSQDGMNYTIMFDKYEQYSDWFFYTNEIMAVAIPVTLKYLGLYSYASVFLLFAFLGVTFKFIAIRKYSLIPLLSVIFYFVSNFLLHEMTQIRAGIATGILLLSVVDIYDKKLLNFLLKVGCAWLFHISSLIFIPFYFINPKKIHVKVYLLGLMFVIPLGAARAFNIFAIFPSIVNFNQKLQIYEIVQSKFQSVNLINVVMLLNLLILMLLFMNIAKVIEKSKYAIIFIKMYFVSILCTFLFSSVPILSWRIGEIFSVSNFIVISYLPYTTKSKTLMVISIVLISLVMLSFYLFHDELIYSYHTLFN